MKIQFEREITLNAPASHVWDILANNYEKVGDWATVIPESAPRTDARGKLAGRTCTSSYGDVKEMITHWDDDQMTYSYEADGLPAMFKQGANTWSVVEVDNNTSKVFMELKMEISPLPGFLIGWIMKPKMSKDMDGLMEDLKHYVEKGTPHPKKVKSLAKWNKRKSGKAA